MLFWVVQISCSLPTFTKVSHLMMTPVSMNHSVNLQDDFLILWSHLYFPSFLNTMWIHGFFLNEMSHFWHYSFVVPKLPWFKDKDTVQVSSSILCRNPITFFSTLYFSAPHLKIAISPIGSFFGWGIALRNPDITAKGIVYISPFSVYRAKNAVIIDHLEVTKNKATRTSKSLVWKGMCLRFLMLQ